MGVNNGILSGVGNGIIPNYSKVISRGKTISGNNKYQMGNFLKLWLKSDAGVTLNGSNVSKWSDLSGNGNDCIQGTTVSQPLLVANQLNGYPVLRFDGINDFMTFASGFMYNWTDVTLLFVIKPTMGSNSGIFAPSTTNSTGLEVLALTGVHELRINGAIKYASGLFTNNSFSISDIEYNATSTFAYKNGTALSPLSGGNALNLNGIYTLGRYSSSYYSAFDVAEIISYNKFLTYIELFQVNNYLKSKYLL